MSDKVKNIIKSGEKIVAIWGYPAPDVMQQVRNSYPNCQIVDLDINYDVAASNILPDAYCKIIHNIVDNAMALINNIEVIVASVGEEKCDSGHFAALILKDMGFNVIQTKYTQYPDKIIQVPVCQSDLPLKNKVLTIMDSLIEPVNVDYKYSNPAFGFWGVPPNDLSVLELFPDKNTHVYGWVRCVEAGRPADFDLEMFVDDNVPTVFFAQAFCSKMQLAKYLAKKYNGLYVDVDDVASNSVKAKIEAFIRLG